MGFIYLDGEFLPEEEAKISVMDRGFLFGDGVYTTIQVRDGIPLFLEIHLERLRLNCAQLNIIPPFIPKESIEELIEKNHAIQGIWRFKILITGGEDPSMRLPRRPFGHLVMTLKPFTPAPITPLQLGLFPYPTSLCHASFKSLAHLNRYYVMEYALGNRFDDAVTTTESGILLEASFGNLLWIAWEDKNAWVPASTLPLHGGVTLSIVKEVLEEAGFKFHEVKWKLADIPPGLTCFRVNSMSGIRPVSSLGDVRFTLNPKEESFLREGYEEYARKSEFNTLKVKTPSL